MEIAADTTEVCVVCTQCCEDCVCLQCQHNVCCECLAGLTQSTIVGQSSIVVCPEALCGKLLEDDEVQRHCSEEQFSRFLDLRRKHELVTNLREGETLL